MLFRSAPSRAAPTGRKQPTSGLQNVLACGIQLSPRHPGPREEHWTRAADRRAGGQLPPRRCPPPRDQSERWGSGEEGRAARKGGSGRTAEPCTSSSPRGKVGGEQKTVLSAGARLSPVLVDPEGRVKGPTDGSTPTTRTFFSFLGGRACAPLPRSWQTPQASAVADLCLEVFHRLPVRVPTEIISYLYRCPFLGAAGSIFLPIFSSRKQYVPLFTLLCYSSPNWCQLFGGLLLFCLRKYLS